MSSENVSAKMRRVIFSDRAAEIRAISDEIGDSMCLPASLAEIGLALGGNIPRLHEAKIKTKGSGDKIGGVSKETALAYMMKETQRMGIRCKRVVGTPGFLTKFQVPAELKDKVSLTEGKTPVTYPNIVLMTTREGLSLHAESQLGDDKTQKRVYQLENQGWRVGMVVEFERSPTSTT